MKFDELQLNGKHKIKFTHHFMSFVNYGCLSSGFRKWFYDILITLHGHKPSTDRKAFYHTWFSNIERRIKFIDYWIKTPVDEKSEYADVEKVLVSWLKANRENIIAFAGELQNKINLDNRAKLESNEYIVALKDWKPDDEGNYKYILLSRKGLTWEVRRNASKGVLRPFQLIELSEEFLESCIESKQIENAPKWVVVKIFNRVEWIDVE